MATLVLSTVGTALGGPLGGALGGMVGQSIDKGLFGPGMGRGPRLGDLSVQTSSYGSPIPRIYGTMRVAGTVVWSTEIRENENIEGGTKGSPEYVAYHYSASFAVALSSRPVREIRRIWADGKLIRGRGGDFKVKTKFRLCPGSEDQPVDRLIASVEGIASAPAYRGLALAIFEDLDLGEFGNRIPVLTFEVVADEATTLGALMRDSSGGAIDAHDERPIMGYAAHGSSIADSVSVLIDLFGIEVTERGGALTTSNGDAPVLVRGDELGADAEGRARSSFESCRAPESAMPASLAMSYYDPDRDYQVGQMTASSGASGVRSERVELPAVLTGDLAKAVVEQALARKWRSGDLLRLRVGPSRVALRPGDFIQIEGRATVWTVRSVTIDGLAVELEAQVATATVLPLPSDHGRAATGVDEPIGRTELALFEFPPAGDRPAELPIAYLAASSAGAWKPVPFELTLGAGALPGAGVSRRALLGFAETVLEPRAPMVLDEQSSVVVRMAGDFAPLLNADHDALMAGANLAVLGDELIQFGEAQELGSGRYRLTKLLRGRRGTEWAAASHRIGEAFCMIDAALRMLELPASASQTPLLATAHGVGDAAPLPVAERIISGEAMRPPSPCHLTARWTGNLLDLSWVRRSHRGWAWLDEVGVPADDFGEAYRVTVEGPGGSLTVETVEPFISIAGSDVPARAGDALKISVTTVGPKAVSREISATLTL